MKLCQDRIQTSFGLSSCGFDIWLLPLATWLFLPLLALSLYLLLRRPSSSSTIHTSSSSYASPPKARKLLLISIVAYLVLLVALFAMLVLEISRLAIADEGVGLLPFGLVGVIGAFAVVWLLHWRGLRRQRSGLVQAEMETATEKGDDLVEAKQHAGVVKGDEKAWWIPRAAMIFYWTLLLAFQAAKVTELKDQEAIGRGRDGYPSSDKVLDNEVILALYALFFLLEVIYALYQLTRRRS